MGDDPIYRRSPGVSFEWSGDRVVVLDDDGTELITLNPTGSVIWEAIGDGQTQAALTAALVGRVDDPDVRTVEADVESFLAELERHGLVEAVRPT